MLTIAHSTFATASRLVQPQSAKAYAGVVPAAMAQALQERMHDGIDLQIAEEVLRMPGQTQAEIAERLGFSCTLVHRRVAAFAQIGGVLRTQCGQRVRSYPTDCLAYCVARTGTALHEIQAFQEEMVCA